MAQGSARKFGMRKSELRITEYVGGIPTKGTCSSCPSVVFSTRAFLGSKADNQAALDLLFAAHFNEEHRHEGSARRYEDLREATE
jgi:hypothetical protein